MPRVALDWHSVTRIVLIDVDLRKFTQIIKANSRSRIDQSAGRRDHKHTGRSTRGPRKCICVGNFSAKIEAAQKGEHVRDWRATFRSQLSGEWKLRLVAQNHLGSFTPGISGREKENPMADALLHAGDFPRARSRVQPYIPSLLFKSGMENIVACVGTGHSNPATVTIGTVTTVTDTTVTVTTSMAAPVMHVPTSYVLERRRPEPLGSTGKRSRIPISGCLQ